MALIDIIQRQNIVEIPPSLKSAFPHLRSYQISRALTELTDLEVGNLVRSRELPPETLLFRGTDEQRYSTKIGELWWTFSLRKAADYARQNQHPLVLVGYFGDVTGQEIQYLDASLYLPHNKGLYQGKFALKPLFKMQQSGMLKLPVLDSVELVVKTQDL